MKSNRKKNENSIIISWFHDLIYKYPALLLGTWTPTSRNKDPEARDQRPATSDQRPAGQRVAAPARPAASRASGQRASQRPAASGQRRAASGQRQAAGSCAARAVRCVPAILTPPPLCIYTQHTSCGFTWRGSGLKGRPYIYTY